jgi:hypothetical protein
MSTITDRTSSRKLVETRLGRQLEPLAEIPLPDADSDHMGINEQKLGRLHYVGFPVTSAP